jgi:hypothetical protein
MRRMRKAQVALMPLLILSLAFVGLAAPQRDARAEVKAQALKVYKAIQKQDWRTMYSLTRFSVTLTQKIGTDVDAFIKGIVKGIDDDPAGRKTTDSVLSGLSNLATGEPVINGDRADVPTSATLTLNGRATVFHGVAHMVRDGDTWKWDLTFTDNPGQATEKGLGDLLGKP